MDKTKEHQCDRAAPCHEAARVTTATKTAKPSSAMPLLAGLGFLFGVIALSSGGETTEVAEPVKNEPEPDGIQTNINKLSDDELAAWDDLREEIKDSVFYFRYRFRGVLYLYLIQKPTIDDGNTLTWRVHKETLGPDRTCAAAGRLVTRNRQLLSYGFANTPQASTDYLVNGFLKILENYRATGIIPYGDARINVENRTLANEQVTHAEKLAKDSPGIHAHCVYQTDGSTYLYQLQRSDYFVNQWYLYRRNLNVTRATLASLTYDGKFVIENNSITNVPSIEIPTEIMSWAHQTIDSKTKAPATPEKTKTPCKDKSLREWSEADVMTQAQIEFVKWLKGFYILDKDAFLVYEDNVLTAYMMSRVAGQPSLTSLWKTTHNIYGSPIPLVECEHVVELIFKDGLLYIPKTGDPVGDRNYGRLWHEQLPPFDYFERLVKRLDMAPPNLASRIADMVVHTLYPNKYVRV